MRSGEIEKRFGISVETLRYYEKEGIIHPKRKLGSTYRDFDMEACFQIFECMTYRNMGLAVRDIAEMLNEESIAKLTEGIRSCEAELSNRLREENILLDCIRKHRICLESLNYNINALWFEELPAYDYVVIGIRNGDEYRYSDEGLSEIVCEWRKKTPYVKISNHIRAEDFYAHHNNAEMVLSIDTDILDVVDLRVNEYVKHVPARKCLKTIIGVLDDAQYLEELRFAIDYLDAKGLMPVDRMIARLIARSGRKQGYIKYYEVYIPFEKKKENT